MASEPSSSAIAIRPSGPFPFRAPKSGPVDLLIIAGEHSGDQNAALMLAETLKQGPDLKVCAFGGPALQAAGADLIHDMTSTSVIGFVDTLKQIGFFRNLLKDLVRWIAEYRPRTVCFVDSSGLNLRIAERLFNLGLSVKAGGPIRTIYYISPQIWASRAKRRFKMAQHLSSIAVIFPFEIASYADTDLKAEFVGHPFLVDGYPSPVSYDPNGPILLLPGSRTKAVERIYPLMLAGYNRHRFREAVSIYPSEAIRTVLDRERGDTPVRLVPAGVPIAASAVLTTSGTMSMHCALAGIPGAVVYKASTLEYWLGRLIVTVPYLGIANLILKKAMYPEYIQNAATSEALDAELHRSLTSRERIQATKEDALQLRSLLSHSGSNRPSEWLLRQMAASPVPLKG